MRITRHSVADKLADYFRHEITLAELVGWAESAMMNGEFDGTDFEAIRNALARIGVADVRTFGLTWEDCEALLKKLGFSAHVDIVAA